jgi:LmbE family N-acetylglucosaminyl deacetylase
MFINKPKLDNVVYNRAVYNKKMNILAIGSHPDDIEIGCFATLAKHKMDGDNIFGVIITKGEIGGNTDVRQREAISAAKVIGMELIFGDFPDGDVRANSQLITFLDNIVKTKKIDIVYTHSLNDRHQDHRAVSRASMSVSRNVQEVYCYEAVSLISSFIPQIFVDVTETFGYKISALRKFESQVERTFVEGLEGLARFRASQTRLPGRLCEAFETYKILRNENSPRNLEVLDLRNQVKEFKRIISNIESEQIDDMLLNSPQIKNEESLSSPYERLFPMQNSKDSIVTKNNEFSNGTNFTNKLTTNEINNIKEEISHYKEEIEKLKREIKGYKDALLLKKEIALYKEALEKATTQNLK